MLGLGHGNQYSLLADREHMKPAGLQKWLAPVGLLLSALFCQNAGSI